MKTFSNRALNKISPPIRILARANYPEDVAPEIDWIKNQVRLLGKSYNQAYRSIQDDIARGYMIIVRTE